MTGEKEQESVRSWGLHLSGRDWDRVLGPCQLPQIPVNRTIKLDKTATDISDPIKDVKPLTELNRLQMLTRLLVKVADTREGSSEEYEWVTIRNVYGEKWLG